MARKNTKNNRKSRSNTSVATQVQKYLLKHAEHKFHSVTVSSAFATTWTVSGITQSLVQGISGTERIGDNIRYFCVRQFGRVTVNTTASFANCRVILVLDKMSDSVAPVVGDLLNSNTVDSTYSAEQIKSKRFTILFDESYALNTQGVGAHMFNRTLNMNQTATYNGITNAVASNGKNSMWLFYVNDNGANVPSMNCNFQVEFTDL